MSQEYELIKKTQDEIRLGDIVRYDSFQVENNDQLEQFSHFLTDPNDGKFFKLVKLVSEKSYDFDVTYEWGHYVGECLDDPENRVNFSIAYYNSAYVIRGNRLKKAGVIRNYWVRVPKIPNEIGTQCDAESDDT